MRYGVLLYVYIQILIFEKKSNQSKGLVEIERLKSRDIVHKFKHYINRANRIRSYIIIICTENMVTQLNTQYTLCHFIL